MTRCSVNGRRGIGAALLAAGSVLLSACAGLGSAADGGAGAGPGGGTGGGAQAARQAAAEASRLAGLQALAMAAFQDRQRALAEAAEQQGQWAQAAWAWEALLAVRPTDAVAERRLQQVRRAADARATLLAQQARLAMQLGDPASARDLYLRALAFQPSQADAIEELRTLEAAQLRGALKAPDPARNLSSSNPPLTAQTLQSAPTLQSAQATQTHATLAFASLLMAQAEHERAVQLLLPLARTAQGGPAARRLLSDVLIDLAERQRADNPVLAVTTAQRSLREDPGNQRAVSRLREWQRARAKRSASDSRVRNTDMR